MTRKQANRKGQGGVPPMVWVLAGLLAGLLLMGVLFLRGDKEGDFVLPRPNPDAQPPADVIDDDSNAADSTPDAADETAKTDFAFYDMLTEKEVAIPDAELSERAQAEARAAAAKQEPKPDLPASPSEPTPPAADASTAIAPSASTAATDPPVTTERYLLQAGAFRHRAQAEDLKARIAMTGEIARIEPAEINGMTVYRVRLGPYSNATSLSAAKQALAQQGLSVQALRAR